MCSIIGSYDINEVKMLASLNAYRGQHSYSMTSIWSNSLDMLTRGLGVLPIEELNKLPQGYIICHQQAPTTDARDTNSIHPASYAGSYLWHNGIIKDKQIKQWQIQYNDSQLWDTAWLVRLIAENGFGILSEVDGTFACVYNDSKHTCMFRNANSPLFRKGSTISSTKFEGSSPITPGRVYIFDADIKDWRETPHTFTTKEQFFWSPT